MKMLRLVRTIRNKRQQDLAKTTRINVTRLSLMESGYVEPSEKELHILAGALGAPADLLNREVTEAVLDRLA